MEGETVERVRIISPKINGDGDRSRVETDLGAVQGVNSVRVQPDAHAVDVGFDPRVTSLPKIQEVLQANGYDVESVQYGARRDDTAADESNT